MPAIKIKVALNIEVNERTVDTFGIVCYVVSVRC